jgi:hypothetical protein
MPEKDAHPLNSNGSFYVENKCCITCDLPRTLGPDMFRYTEKNDHCYVYQQPTTEDQLGRMIQVMRSSEVSCIRCRSRDTVLLSQLLSDKEL